MLVSRISRKITRFSALITFSTLDSNSTSTGFISPVAFTKCRAGSYTEDPSPVMGSHLCDVQHVVTSRIVTAEPYPEVYCASYLESHSSYPNLIRPYSHISCIPKQYNIQYPKEYYIMLPTNLIANTIPTTITTKTTRLMTQIPGPVLYQGIDESTLFTPGEGFTP
jgi:hypothetical protein